MGIKGGAKEKPAIILLLQVDCSHYSFNVSRFSYAYKTPGELRVVYSVM